jgi:two-component system, NarL family, nitrate/nitrite response regulator NarL
MDDIGVLVVGSVGLAQDLVLACRRRSGIRILGPVEDATEAVSAAAIAPVDLAIVDVDPPEGLEALHDLHAALPDLRIVAASTAVDPEHAGDALTAGAAGLLTRGMSPADTVHALRRAAAGEVVLADAHLRAVVDVIHERRAEAAQHQRIRSLTARERQVLSMLAEGMGTAEMAAALGVSAATVQAHVKAVLRKFGVHSKVEAVRLAWRSGEPVPVPVGA